MKTITEFLGGEKNTRNLFADWYNKTQAGKLSLVAFLKLDTTYQIGTYIQFLLDNNICCSIYVDAFDLFIINNALLPDTCDYTFTIDYHLDDHIKYISKSYYGPNIFTDVIELYTQAIKVALRFLNTYKMKDNVI